MKCKWCGNETTMEGTQECDRCWELRHRIEDDLILVMKITKAVVLKGKNHALH